LAGRVQSKKKSKHAYPSVSWILRFKFRLSSYDVDFPIECDDEYWTPTDRNQAFTQPLGKPSIISGFVYYIKLCEILAFSLKTLYSTKKSKLLSGLTGNQWERQVVTELDSAMNNWKDSLPPHRAFLLRFKSPVPQRSPDSSMGPHEAKCRLLPPIIKPPRVVLLHTNPNPQALPTQEIDIVVIVPYYLRECS
jgi:hypothetical protein